MRRVEHMASNLATQPRIDDRDWSSLTIGEQLRMLELEGYLVLPNLLSAEQIAALKEWTAQLPTVPASYSEHQRGHTNPHRQGGALAELPGNPRTVAFLREVFGDELIVMSYVYAISK